MQGDEVHSYKYLIKHHSSALNFQNCIVVLYCPHFLLTAISNSHRRPIGTSHYGYTSVRQRHEYLLRRRWARQAASESTETTCIATKRRHDTGDSTQNASTRPRLNSSQFEFGAGSPAAFESETPLVLFPTSTAYTEEQEALMSLVSPPHRPEYRLFVVSRGPNAVSMKGVDAGIKGVGGVALSCSCRCIWVVQPMLASNRSTGWSLWARLPITLSRRH